MSVVIINIKKPIGIVSRDNKCNKINENLLGGCHTLNIRLLYLVHLHLYKNHSWGLYSVYRKMSNCDTEEAKKLLEVRAS